MSGFTFDFGDAPGDEGRQSPLDVADTNAALVPHGVEEYCTLAQLVSEWAGRYPAKDTVVSTVIDGPTSSSSAVLHYQQAPHIPALQGSADRRDIVPGRYLGGLKVWSCARDVAAYAYGSEALRLLLRVPGAKVLEVGCGQALPSMAALLAGARSLTCHDYNAEVLTVCTKPNIAFTCGSALNSSAAATGAVSFRAAFGDWDNFDPHDGLFHVILGSDVTYDPIACEKLARLVSRLLHPDGAAIIGTKEFYFGTNGGSRELKDAVTRVSNGAMVTREVCRASQEANELSRVIVEIRWGQPCSSGV